MPVTATYTVEGLAELVEQLENLNRRAQRTMIRKGLRKAARPVVNSARSKARVRRGGLKRGIRAVVKGQGKDVVAEIGFVPKRFYGQFHELGTSKMAARPFLRPALDENHAAATAAFRETLEEEIAAAIAKAAVTDAGGGEEVIE